MAYNEHKIKTKNLKNILNDKNWIICKIIIYFEELR